MSQSPAMEHSFHPPCGRAGDFLDSGHPALRGVAASFAVRAAPAAQCLCKESSQRNTPPVARSPGIRQLLLHCSTSGIPAVACPSDFASGGRVPLTGHPWPAAESARSLAPTLRASSPATRRAAAGPVWATSCRRSKSKRSHSFCVDAI